MDPSKQVPEENPEYGMAVEVAPGVRRLLARNPGPFTYTGTGTFIIGYGSVAVIDPGPDMPEHFADLKNVLRNETVSHILVTHTHMDHSPLARPLAAETGAPIYAYGPHGSGRDGGLAGETVEAGADVDFDPDIRVGDGEVIEGQGWSVEAVHTPGHTSNHLCFAYREPKLLFTGDHVMGWNTTVISPPDGDMALYLDSLAKVAARDDVALFPTHGPPVEKSPQRYVNALLGHRKAREKQILDCLKDGISDIPSMVARMYKETPKQLYPAASRSVLAHLIHMVDTGRASCDGAPAPDARFAPPN